MINKRRYATLINKLNNAIYVCDEQGVLILHNKIATNDWGISTGIGNYINQNSHDILDDAGNPFNFTKYITNYKNNCQKITIEVKVKVIGIDKSYRDGMLYTSFLFDSKGNFTGTINMLISNNTLGGANEKNILEQKLNEEKAHLELS